MLTAQSSARPQCVTHRMTKILESLSAISRLFCISRNHFCAADARQINDQMESRHCLLYSNFRRPSDKLPLHITLQTLNSMPPTHENVDKTSVRNKFGIIIQLPRPWRVCGRHVHQSHFQLYQVFSPLAPSPRLFKRPPNSRP